MRLLVITVVMLAHMTVAAQSKKELQAEVSRLRAEVEALKKPKEAPLDLTDRHQEAGYAAGVLLAQNLRNQGGDSLNAAAIGAGLSDVFLGKELKMNVDQCMRVIQPYLQTAMEYRNEKIRTENLNFLAENRNRDDVRETPTGLQYRVIRAGSGPSPGPDDSVTVHYKGSLIDGHVFDQSEPDNPVTFTPSEVIPGWTEALMLMHEGDLWEIFLPYPLAYGERGAGMEIPPYATLIFEIELLKVTPSAPPEAPKGK
ncbi:MAG TPA: FKBP-type peptidyl-prolyl cis-trans isomerase [Cyclobacteriaceae bacterium]|jgi:FKBP-type peptidyl-prolyl cis-trans isomerase FklB